MQVRQQVRQDEMAVKETEDFVFTPTGEPEQLWVLSKASGETYRVDLKDFVCSCADFHFRQAKGDRLCKHLEASCEAYGVEPKPRLPAVREEITAAITVSQQEVVKELSKELRDEMVKNYVYAVPDYEREYADKSGRKRTVKKQGWIDLRAAGVRDLAHMVADRYGEIELGEFRFMDAQTKWLAWRDIRLGNFTATGFAECDKEKEFPFRYLGEVVMRNAYKSIVPKIYQDIFTNKFRQLMRSQLKELAGETVEGKPVEELSDGELTRALVEAQREKRLPGAEKGETAKTAPTHNGALVPQAATPVSEEEEGFHIDPIWLKESLKEIKWSDDTAKSWLANKFKVDSRGTLADVLPRLTREQAEEFVEEVQNRLANKQMDLWS